MTEAINKREKKITRMRKYLIEITEELIQQEGVENVTLRRVADEAGYNSATIYNYFTDLDELILYSSVKFLKTYNAGLSKAVSNDMNAMERYIRVFNIFSRHTFASPEIYYNMFYGRHSKKLDQILRNYYIMFPNELGTHSEAVKSMLYCGDIFERERFITRQIYLDGFATEEDVRHLVDIAIWSHEYLLKELCDNKGSLTIEGQAGRYENCLLFVLRKMKLPESDAVPSLLSDSQE